jgi:hypothetical protein
MCHSLQVIHAGYGILIACGSLAALVALLLAALCGVAILKGLGVIDSQVTNCKVDYDISQLENLC